MEDGAPARTVTLVYFAWVRERTGTAREQIVLPAAVGTLGELVAWLRTRGPGYEHAFARPEVIRAAINQTHAKPDASLDGAREIAFFPPVTGG